MKIRPLTPILTLLVLSFTFFLSCKKDNPSHPPPPTDSTNIVDLKKGLLLYLPFSGNFADSSGNHNPTAGVGGVTLASDQKGSASSAMNGTGHGGSVVVTNNGSIKFDSAFTVSVNVLTHSTTELQAYIAMVKDVDAKGLSFGFGQGVPGSTLTEMSVAKKSLTCNDVTDPSNTVMNTSSLTLETETWYNLVSTFYKGTIKIYANGTLVGTQTGADPVVPVCPEAQVLIGAWWNGSESINGKLDEVRLYNRALNDMEIAKLAQGFPVQSAPVADLTRGLLLYLPFNGSMADSSGNNNPTQAIGDATLTYNEHGYANSAYGSSGNGGALIVTNNGSIKFDSAISVSFNVMTRTTDLQSYVGMFNNSDATGFSFGISEGIPGLPVVEAGVSTTPAICDQITNASNLSVDTSTLTLQPEAWYNLIFTFNKGVIKLYANGTLISSRTGPVQTIPICPGSQILIGSWWNASETLNGKMDNVRLYNRELIPEEISHLSKWFRH